MKKILLLSILGLILLSGCGMKQEANTPEEAVNAYFSRIQTRDDSMIEMLDNWLMGQNLEEEQRKEYQTYLEKQYQNLSYEIINVDKEEDFAMVEVEIEVLDYQSSFKRSKDYFRNHQEEFMDSVVEEDQIDNVSEFIAYKIKELAGVEEKAKYRITLELEKNNGDWEIQEIDNDTFLKLYGLY